jgi:hypothetical protein
MPLVCPSTRKFLNRSEALGGGGQLQMTGELVRSPEGEAKLSETLIQATRRGYLLGAGTIERCASR